MRKLILIIILICACGQGQAQINMLHNPSFEKHWRCPEYIDLVKYANYWTSINDTVVSDEGTLGFPPYYICLPEYCNSCSDYIESSVPNNTRFNHYPRTGDGMMQVLMYENQEGDEDPDAVIKRDYLQGRLKVSLTAGREYCVRFYVSLENASAYAVNHIGAYFDDGTIDTTTACSLPQTEYTPQIIENSILTDTAGWIKVQGMFVANGTEKFMTIGNFFDKEHTDTISVHFAHAVALSNGIATWYLVDDISVIALNATADAGRDTTIVAGDSVWIGNQDDYLPCKWYTATGTLIDSNHAGMWVKPTTTTSYVMELDVCGTLSYDTVKINVWNEGVTAVTAGNIKLYPTPAHDKVTVTGLTEPTPYRLLNAVGVTVMSGVIDKGNTSIDVSGCVSGVYVVELSGSGCQRVMVVKE